MYECVENTREVIDETQEIVRIPDKARRPESIAANPRYIGEIRLDSRVFSM